MSQHNSHTAKKGGRKLTWSGLKEVGSKYIWDIKLTQQNEM